MSFSAKQEDYRNKRAALIGKINAMKGKERVQAELCLLLSDNLFSLVDELSSVAMQQKILADTYREMLAVTQKRQSEKK